MKYLLILLLFFSTMLNASNSHHKNGEKNIYACTGCAETSKSIDKKNAVENSKAKIGDITKCPISGVYFKVVKNTPTVIHKGKSFKFCCDGCSRTFKKNNHMPI